MGSTNAKEHITAENLLDQVIEYLLAVEIGVKLVLPETAKHVAQIRQDVEKTLDELTKVEETRQKLNEGDYSQAMDEAEEIMNKMPWKNLAPLEPPE